MNLLHDLPRYKSTSPQAPRFKAAPGQILAVLLLYQNWRSVSYCSRLQVKRLQHAPSDSSMKQTLQMAMLQSERAVMTGKECLLSHLHAIDGVLHREVVQHLE